ncbi:putative LNK family protein [Helianthus annuus]|uniref:LNK family protein n=1 Tax=Helianthus annuus TaxID=4232 RepID=A0A251S3I5_HELAN|nr:protein LNK1 [Helianthus annuus]XP_022018863.1 protein LNK1 [Helianthus annuus]KAF5760214.1 putative LNK family protein [Helianthus annuus]KAJ0438294.1 putative LNK family protein [Helianthus annuus]KAJ0460619.1 putative LNK family protein [Helianthus annuus]
MEKESPSHAPPGVFNASCDGDIVKDMPNLASDDTRMPNNCFKSSYATSASADNNSYSYTLTQAGDLCFVDSNCEKESGDLLYYGWPDIGNFDDVDKMLRSCDSSFGLGATDNADELGWFSSDQVAGTEEALKMDFKFLCQEPSGLKNILHADHDSPESNNRRPRCIFKSKDELNFKDQNKQSKHQNQMEAKKAGQGTGNDDGSFYQTSGLTVNDSRLSSNNISDQVYTSVDNQQPYRNLETDYFGHMQSNTFYLHPDYPHQTTSVPMLSGSSSEHRGLKSTSPMGSSYTSNQIRSTENSGEVDERKQSRNSHGFPTGMMFQPSKGVMVSAEKQVNLSVKERESDIEGVPKAVEIGSLNGPESSSVSSRLDEISLEATSFRQLRLAMEQLDVRSKLCIRDSLYRLARSAEQRHNDPILTSSNDLGRPLMAERSNKCTGFMDIETDTNPIDRSVAHLLFHRPSESPKLPTPLPPNPNMNQGSIRGTSMLVEKLVCLEEAGAESNDRICGD